MSDSITFALDFQTLGVKLEVPIESRTAWQNVVFNPEYHTAKWQAVDLREAMIRDPGPWIRALGLHHYHYIHGLCMELLEMAQVTSRIDGDDLDTNFLLADLMSDKNSVRIINHDLEDRLGRMAVGD